MNEHNSANNRLNEYRVHKGVTQDELAEMLGVAQSQISRGEAKKDISGDVLVEIVDSLEDLDWIVCGGEKPWEKHKVLHNYFEEAMVNNQVRLEEGILYGLEKSETVSTKYAREIQFMKRESANKGEEYLVMDNLRECHGMTRGALAYACKIDGRVLAKYRNHQKIPGLNDMVTLCEVLHTRPSVLISNSAYQMSILEEMFECSEAGVQNHLISYLKYIM